MQNRASTLAPLQRVLRVAHHESCLTWSHVTTSVLLCENYSGCQLVNESCISCVFSFTRHRLDSRQTTSQTYSSQSLPLHPGPHCGTPVAETMSCHGRTGKWRIEHFPLLHRERGTNCRLNWKEQNQQLLFAEDWKRSSSIVHTAPNNTWYNDHVMRPRSYSRGLRNIKYVC